MAHTVERAARGFRTRPSARAGFGGGRRGERRHPLVAVAMVLPAAAVLAVAFGAVEAVAEQASSVAGMLGH